MIQTVNPATNQPIASYADMSMPDAQAVIDRVHAAFGVWRRTDFSCRAKLLNRLADVLEERKIYLTDIMTAEMGKIKAQGIAEIEKCAATCRYYARHGESLLADDVVVSPSMEEEYFVTFQPIGVVLAVMPWNFPFWQVIRFAAPTLMAGNGCVLKHATSVTGCAVAIEQLFRDAGFPEDIFRVVFVEGAKASDLIDHRHIRAVTLTGSTKAGAAVGARAGAALKKSVLELGGSDAHIILSDADIHAAAQSCVHSRLINTGQSCIAAKRFIVEEPVYNDFIDAFKAEMEIKIMGDPTQDNTDIGPMSAISFRDELHQQVQQSVAKGAKCILGGSIPERQGAWYPATILIDVEKGMPAYDQELFGPVAAIIKAKDRADAIRIANDSDFGLGGSVYTADILQGQDIARTQLEAGMVAVNDFVKSTPALPFGGVKQSGYGRELGGFGIKEFVNIKSVTVKKL